MGRWSRLPIIRDQQLRIFLPSTPQLIINIEARKSYQYISHPKSRLGEVRSKLEKYLIARLICITGKSLIKRVELCLRPWSLKRDVCLSYPTFRSHSSRIIFYSFTSIFPLADSLTFGNKRKLVSGAPNVNTILRKGNGYLYNLLLAYIFPITR